MAGDFEPTGESRRTQAEGTMIAGQDGGAIGAAAVLGDGPTRPHILVVAKRGETSVEIKVAPETLLRFAQACVPMTDLVKSRQQEWELKGPPERREP